MHIYLLPILSIAVSLIQTVQGNHNEYNETKLHHIQRREACPDLTMCRSKWGHCGTGKRYCGDDCIAGPCLDESSNGSSIITEENFACVFNTIDAETRSNRLTDLRNSAWKPLNKDEAAVFLAHVFHESDGLKAIREYCAPGEYSLKKTSLKMFA
jgi:hypothetical protein